MAFECLICGKSNFAVNDGKARCKDCGMEYSLEDIMKATLSYSSVTTEKIDGQMKNAEREYSIGHYQKAADILTSVLSIQPDNTEALYRKALADGAQSSLNEGHFMEMAKEYVSALELKKSDIGDLSSFIEQTTDSILQLFSAFLDAFVPYREKIKNDYGFEMEMGHIKSRYIAEMYQNMTFMGGYGDTYETRERIKQADIEKEQHYEKADKIRAPYKQTIQDVIPDYVCGLACLAGYMLTLYENNENTAPDSFWKFMEEITDKLLHLEKFGDSEIKIDPPSSLYKNAIEEKKKKAKQRAIESYWSMHEEEKCKLIAEKQMLIERQQKLLAEISEADTEIAKIQDKFSCLTANEEVLSGLSSRSRELNARMASLGLFKMKAKGELKEQIAILNAQMNKIKPLADQERTQANKEMNAECQPYIENRKAKEEEYADTNRAIAAIDLELTKDR